MTIIYILLYIKQYKQIHSMKNIDLRSDTVTQLTKQMRQCILTAEYGDHTYGEDSTVLQLQMLAAELLGKQAASFVPTGVFGNQCAILTAGTPGTQIILGDKSHIISYENGSVGKLSRMMTRTIQCDQSMFMPVKNLKNWIRKIKDSQAPNSTIFSIQNPTSCGRIYPMQHFNELIKIGKDQGMHVHMDGARIFNACAQLKMDPKQLVKQCDSVMFCLSKGLCTPIGSMVVGTRQFIAKFNKNRKMLGGILRKPGILAQMGIIALNTTRLQLLQDNESARKLSKKLASLGWIQIVEKVQTNMIFFKITDKRVDPQKLKQHLLSNGIKAFINSNLQQSSRLVTHHYIRQSQIQKIYEQFSNYYLQNVQKNNTNTKQLLI